LDERQRRRDGGDERAVKIGVEMKGKGKGKSQKGRHSVGIERQDVVKRR
jgi:hypothetical protein